MEFNKDENKEDLIEKYWDKSDGPTGHPIDMGPDRVDKIKHYMKEMEKALEDNGLYEDNVALWEAWEQLEYHMQKAEEVFRKKDYL